MRWECRQRCACHRCIRVRRCSLHPPAHQRLWRSIPELNDDFRKQIKSFLYVQATPAGCQLTVYNCFCPPENTIQYHLAVNSRTMMSTGSDQQLWAFTERLTWLTISPRKGSKSQSTVSPEGTTSKCAASRYGFPTQHRQYENVRKSARSVPTKNPPNKLK